MAVFWASIGVLTIALVVSLRCDLGAIQKFDWGVPKNRFGFKLYALSPSDA